MQQIKVCMMLVLAAIVFGTGVAGAAPEVITLKVAHFLPASSSFNLKNAIPWCDKINKESNGRLKCQIYPSMQLGGTPSQLFDQARDGVADIVWTVPTYQAGRFTKAEVFELPFMVKSAEKGAAAMWDYVHKNAMDEFKGVKLIFTHVHDGSQLHFGSKSVKTLEDLKGLKIRSPNRIGAKTLAALGAVPVQMPIPAVPESLAKAVIDGASLPWEVTPSLKLNEICKTSTETGPNQAKHANAIFVFAMNQAKYNSLPADLKKVIDQNSGIETSKWVGKISDEGMHTSRKVSVDRKNTINTLSDAEYKRWMKVTEQVDDEWVKEVNAKGGNGRALYNEAKALLKKYHD
jgi:TRAP-type C4-dicarboxylate transport system substrate-binding protein